MWFDRLAASENPGREELGLFVNKVREFLGFVLEYRNDFGFLWEGADNILYELAWDTFRHDVEPGAEMLMRAIEDIPQEAIDAHGLEGRPLKFKFHVLDSIDKQWERLQGLPSLIRPWFKKIIDAIDAILDSLIQAAASAVGAFGVGGILKEFKDALAALA